MPLETRPGKLRELEAETGRPLSKLIPDTLREHGSIIRAAAALGVNPNTIRFWLASNGLQVQTIRSLRVVPKQSR